MGVRNVPVNLCPTCLSSAIASDFCPRGFIKLTLHLPETFDFSGSRFNSNLSFLLSMIIGMYCSPVGILFFHSPRYPNLLFFNKSDASKKGSSTINESDFILMLFTSISSLEFLIIHEILPDEIDSTMLNTML